MWRQLISQLTFELFAEGICLFLIKQTCHYLNNQTIFKLTRITAQLFEITLFIISILIFSHFYGRLPIFLTTYSLMTISLVCWFVAKNRTHTNTRTYIPRKSTLLTPSDWRENRRIRSEYTPEHIPYQKRFQSFYHSTPHQLSTPNLDQISNISSPPKIDSQLLISPIPTNQSKSNFVASSSDFSVQRSPIRANLSPMRHNTTNFTPTNTSLQNVQTTYVNTQPIVSSQISSLNSNPKPIYNSRTDFPAKMEPNFKLRTFQTSASNFNFWTNQIMRHIITPFSSTPQKRTDGPCGLRNTGNVCFLNSIFQSLTVLPLFRSKLIEYSKNNFGAFTGLIGTMTQFVTDSDSLVHDPIYIIRELSPLSQNLLANPDSYIVMQSQQDAGEFFLFLIDALNSIFSEFLSPMPVSKEMTEKAIELYHLPDGLDFTDLNILDQVRNLILKKLEKAVVSNGETYKLDLAILAELEWHIYAGKHSTPLYQLFCGQLVEARYCMSCQGLSLNLEAFTLLPLPIPDTNKLLIPIEEVLERFSRVEGLFGREKLRCTRCENTTDVTADACQAGNGLQEGQRRALLTKLPNYLIVQLSRFHYDPIQKFPYKNNKHVSFPLRGLDLSQVYYESVINSTSHNCFYDLKAVVVHSNGSTALSGHYIAYTKYSDKWWLCNDSQVSRVDMESEKSSNYVLENAYILFYARQERTNI